MGKSHYELEYPCEEHSKRISWLYKHASITEHHDFEYEGENIKVTMLLDDIIYKRYLKEFSYEDDEIQAQRMIQKV
jgi:hypothetical protein